MLTTVAGLLAAIWVAPQVHSEARAPVVEVVYDSSAQRLLPSATRALIDSIARSTAAEVAAVLPGTPAQMRLRVLATGPVIPETGEGGRATAPGVIEWSVNPSAPGGAEAVVRARLRKTLFHEIHHLVRGWTVMGGRPLRSIMDAVVAEGMATVFAREFAQDDAPWSFYPDEVADWARELHALPPSALGQYLQWMFQHPDGRRWIGYRTGTWIAERAVTRSGRSAAELAAVPTDEILALAGVGGTE